MALPPYAREHKFLIQPETAPGSGTYDTGTICGLTTKGFEISASAQETEVPDCTPGLPAWVDRAIKSMSGTLSGSGVLALDTWDNFRDWMLGAEIRRCRVVLDVPLASNGGYFLASFVMTKLGIPSEQGGVINVEMEFQSSGAITWVDAAA